MAVPSRNLVLASEPDLLTSDQTLSARKQTFCSLPTSMPLFCPLAVQQKFWGTLELNINPCQELPSSTSKVMTVLVTLDPATRLKDLTLPASSLVLTQDMVSPKSG